MFILPDWISQDSPLIGGCFGARRTDRSQVAALFDLLFQGLGQSVDHLRCLFPLVDMLLCSASAPWQLLAGETVTADKLWG